MSSIVDDRGRMLGCTYDYTDKDNDDLEQAISKATAVQAATEAAAEDDHAAAIFGGSKDDDSARGTGAPLRSRSHRQARSPDRSRERHARDRHHVSERYHDRDHVSRRHDGAEPDRYRQHRDHRPDRHGPRGDRDGNRERRHSDRALARDERRDRGAEQLSRGDRGCRDRSPARGSKGDRGAETRRHRGRDEGRSAGEQRREGDSRGRDGEQRGGEADGGARRHAGHRDRRSPGSDGAQAAAAPGGRAHGTVRPAGGHARGMRGVARPRGRDSETDAPEFLKTPADGIGASGHRETQAGIARTEEGKGVGIASLGAIVPEGAVVVEESEMVRAAPVVAEHHALDAAAVLKARGSWRDKLRQRMEGIP